MKKSKILISAVTMFSLCITPMSVYAQVDPNSNIENTISQTKSAENLPTPVLQEKEIEVSNGTGYSLNNIQGAETVKALEQGTIVISYKATGENAIQSLFSVGNGTNGNQNRHFHIYVTNSGGVGMELRNTDGDFKYTLDRPAAVRGSYKGERVSNTIAFKADKENNELKESISIAVDTMEELKKINNNDGMNKKKLKEIQDKEHRGEPFETLNIWNAIVTEQLKELLNRACEVQRVAGAWAALIAGPTVMSAIDIVYETEVDEFDNEELYTQGAYFILRAIMKMHGTEI